MTGTQPQHVLIQQAPNARLHDGCRRVGDLVTGQLQDGARDDQAGDQREHPEQGFEPFAGERTGHRLAREREPPHRQRHRRQTDQRRDRNPPTDTAAHAEQPPVEVHRSLPLSVHVPLVGLTDPAARRLLTLSASAEPASSDDAVAFFAARTLRRLHPLGHMRTQEPPARVRPGRASAGGRKAALLLGAAIGSVGLLVLGVIVGGPFVLAKRGDLPLERVYGDFAVSMASRIGGGNRQNPQANDRRALAAGREAYTGSCAVCHGATGDGRGVFGTSSYPNATDLRSHDAIEKSDAQMYWIIQNGLNFTGMPGFGDQYSDQDIWSLVTYIRALQDPARASQPATSQPGPSGGSGESVRSG